MSRVVLSRRAQADLVDIGRFISRHNEPAAKKWVRKLRATCKTTIGMFPSCGTQMDNLLPGMRCFSVGGYLIFFHGRDPVEILRIINGAVDFNQLKFTE